MPTEKNNEKQNKPIPTASTSDSSQQELSTTFQSLPTSGAGNRKPDAPRLLLKEYTGLVHNANLQWWTSIQNGEPLQRNIGELLMLIVSEIAEAMEGHRKDLQDTHLPQHKMFDVELVDAIIRLFDVMEHRRETAGVDYDRIFWEKMAYNAKRADHKIENRLKAGGKKY